MNKLMGYWNRLFGSGRRALTALAVVGILLAGFWLSSSAFDQELTSLTDRALSPSELSKAADCLAQWGQTFRIRGSRILVDPASRDELAARMDFLGEVAGPDTSAFEPMAKGSSIFLSESERQRRWKLDLEESLAAQIRNFKGLKAARVFLASAAKAGFGKPAVAPAASVIVWTDNAQPLDLALAQAIRLTITGTVAGLTCSNVHVIDAGTGCYVPAAQDGAAGVSQAVGSVVAGPRTGELCRRAEQLESRLEQKIRDTFTYIPDLLVCVTVRPESLLDASDTDAPAVSASVNIPRSYLMSLAPSASIATETDFELLAAEQTDRVGQAVRAIIGRPSSSLVHVDWYYDCLPADAALLAEEQASSSALGWLQPAHVAGAIAMITLLALLAVFVRRLIGPDRDQRAIALSRLDNRQTYLDYTASRQLPSQVVPYCGPVGVEVSAFEGLIRLDEATLRGLLSRTEPRIVALALRTSSDKLRRKILSCLSANHRQDVHDHPDFLGPVRLSDIEAAQQEMVDLLEPPGRVDSDELVASAEASVT